MVSHKFSISSIQQIQSYFLNLDNRPAELNPLLLLSWSKSLDLRYIIEDEILYVLANFESQPCLWCPPIGKNLSIEHIYRAFELLSATGNRRINYCWNNYSLWKNIEQNQRIKYYISDVDYIYKVSELLNFNGNKKKNVRHARNNFIKCYDPIVCEYNLNISDGCLSILKKWIREKRKRIDKIYRHKLELEYNACLNALKSNLPLRGVVAFVKGKPIAFSLGYEHDASTFNCVFEKTDPEFKNGYSYIFPELAKFCVNRYSFINAGEDWRIDYLRNAKNKWRPLKQNLYSVELS